ncbi:MAG: type IV pilin protein [Telluria sp.]
MKHCNGFTLIELLVVVAIVGILGAIAYPSYASYMAGARRVEGQVALLVTLQKQERYYAQHNTYAAFSADDTGPGNKVFAWWSGASAAQSAYELSGRACPGLPLQRCIELRAVPGTAKVDNKFRDEQCQTLTLSSSGQTGATGPRKRCWP